MDRLDKYESENEKEQKKLSGENEKTVISSILSNHVYNYPEVKKQKKLTIGEINPYTLVDSSDGINIWRTDQMQYMVALRGTNSLHDTHTWPQILLSQETNPYLPYLNHFNTIIAYVQDYLKTQGVTGDYSNVLFTGHSLGGAAARVSKQTFPGSSAVLHQPGIGLLADTGIQKTLRSFLKANVGMAIKSVANNYLSPVIGEPLSDGISLLGYQWFNHQINEYTNFNMENVSIHRTENDLVSQMGARLPNVTTHANPGFKYNFLENHKMDYLAGQVKQLYGMEHLKIEEMPNEIIQTTIKDINKFVFNHNKLLKDGFWMLDMSTPQDVYSDRQILGEKAVNSQTDLVQTSRNAFRKNINKFNI